MPRPSFEQLLNREHAQRALSLLHFRSSTFTDSQLFGLLNRTAESLDEQNLGLSEHELKRARQNFGWLLDDLWRYGLIERYQVSVPVWHDFIALPICAISRTYISMNGREAALQISQLGWSQAVSRSRLREFHANGAVSQGNPKYSVMTYDLVEVAPFSEILDSRFLPEWKHLRPLLVERPRTSTTDWKAIKYPEADANMWNKIHFAHAFCNFEWKSEPIASAWKAVKASDDGQLATSYEREHDVLILVWKSLGKTIADLNEVVDRLLEDTEHGHNHDFIVI